MDYSRLIPIIRRLALEAGDIDIAESLPVDQTEAIAAADGVKVETYPSLLVTYLYLNNAKPPFDNPAARKAMVSAVDRAGIIDGIMMGKAQPMNGPIPEGRRMFAVSADETIRLAAGHGLSCSHRAEREDMLGRVDVSWSFLALRRGAAGA